MDIYLENIEVKINGTVVLTNMKWFRGASRYNNGATLYGRKYLMRLVCHGLKLKNKNKLVQIFTNTTL